MTANDETTPRPDGEDAGAPRTDDVALSPYDSDLTAPRDDAEPEPYALDDSAGYQDDSAGYREEPADSGFADGSGSVSVDGSQDAAVVAGEATSARIDGADAGPDAVAAPAVAAEPVDEAERVDAAEHVDASEPAAWDHAPDAAEPSTAEPTAQFESGRYDAPSRDEAAVPAAQDETVVPEESTRAFPVTTAGAAAVGAGAGVAGAAATEPGPSDTAVRRTSLIRPAERPSNEPTRLRTAEEADSRMDNYAPASDDDIFGGGGYDRVPSRAGAHWWSIIGTILLTPVAWYLLSDAGARMTLPAGSQWEIGVLNLAAVGELIGGLIVLVVLLLAARSSSVGAFVAGAILTIAGAAFVVVPRTVQDLIDPLMARLAEWNDFGGNVAHHFVADGSTGRILASGVALIVIGFISHGARRKGRAEQRIREAISRRESDY